jgi:transcriptional regulator with XRE-family HTH domain
MARTVGQRIRFNRERLGLSISNLAQRSGLTERFVAMVENGAFPPKTEELERFADGLRVPPARLCSPSAEELTWENFDEVVETIPVAIRERIQPLMEKAVVSYREKNHPLTNNDWMAIRDAVRGAKISSCPKCQTPIYEEDGPLCENSHPWDVE